MWQIPAFSEADLDAVLDYLKGKYESILSGKSNQI